jgi:hypothetical protein
MATTWMATMTNAAKSMAERLQDAVLSVTKDWAKQRKAEERHASARANRQAKLTRPRASDFYNFKSAAFEIMPTAYLAASANDTLPASARQVMYQARPFIQDKMNGQQLNDQYFCQQLLPAYVQEYRVKWDITYDDRGHFSEPHTGHAIGLGTISVRNYCASIAGPKLVAPGLAAAEIATRGPTGCYGAVLFCEKEGFVPLFEAVNLAERFDIALMSTKGMSVTAARTLVDHLAKYQIPLLVLHDFDKSGFSIIGTLRQATRRYAYGNRIKVIDLGLRLADVRALGLEASAEDAFDRGSDAKRRQNMLRNGATAEEADFMLHQRVELNALTSDQLVAFIERKLTEHGIKKIIPDADLLRDAYRLFATNKRVEEIVAEAVEDVNADDIDAPDDIHERVAAYLKEHPTASWAEAVAAFAEDDSQENDEPRKLLVKPESGA